MLYKFLSDALSALRLRFAPPVHYRYAPVVVIAILLLMAAVNAVGMTPVFGNSNGALGFALCLTILKVFVLARSMTITLNYFGGTRFQLMGFILVTEALMIPTLLIYYVPQMAVVALFWQVWTFWVQVIGLMRISGQPVGKVLIGYFVYLVALMLIGSLFMALFVQVGWLDLQQINIQMEEILKNQR
ncbi:MAG: hypothetical protein WBO82_00520 [Neisseria sp.]